MKPTEIRSSTEQKMLKSVESLKHDLAKIRTGRDPGTGGIIAGPALTLLMGWTAKRIAGGCQNNPNPGPVSMQ